jgi:replicative DNA helicase
MTDKIVQEIREIENNCVDLVVKEYKMIRLSQRLKMSRKTLEQLYCKFLLSNENDRIYEADDFQGKFGHESKEWFLHGLLPKGVVLMLHALGGEGKTKLSYDFVNSILTGTPWGQFPVTASTRRCLLVQTDETRGDLIRNLEGRGIERHSSLFIKSRWTTEHMASLRKDIIDHKIEVVVIDSLTTVSKGSIVSENETEYAKPILQLKDLAQELGVTILLIHHSNGQGKSRGTKAIHNSVSQVLSLSKPSEGSDVTCPYRLLVIEKSRFRRPAKYKLEYKVNEEDHTWSWEVLGEDSKEPDPIAPVKEQVVEFLSKNRNTPLTNKDISSELGVPYNTIRKTTFQLSTDGIIQREKQDSTKNTWSFFLAWEGEPQETIVNDPIDETFCVEYIGKDPIVKESAKNATELRFIGFDHEDGLAIIKITKPNWIQTQKVGINDIREVQPCLDT